jgi:TrmH family RNA methyltransferase
MLAEVVRREVRPRFVFCTEGALQSQENRQVLQHLVGRGITYHLVSAEVMSACSDTVTPSGLLAVVPFPDIPLPPDPGWTLVIDNLRTPGNLGTILRTAAAAGVDQVLLSPGTVDPYNPKVVRGGAGASFFLPLARLSWRGIAACLQRARVWLAAAQGECVYTTVDWTRPTALIIGSEAHGASPEAIQLADGQVTIPMARTFDSLNAAVAAGILLFEIARQRRETKRSEQ